MTTLEVIDSAIKIGLGALIGGIFAYLLSSQAHKQELHKEILLDHRKTLREVCANFENIHSKVVALSHNIVREYDSYIRKSEAHLSKGKSIKSRAKAKEPREPDFYERRFDIAEKLLLELYSLQGVLMLYGYKKMSSIIYDYTFQVSVISPEQDKRDSADSMPDPDQLKRFFDLRVEFYEAANEYLTALGSK